MKRRDLQQMRARRLSKNRDRFATPLNVGTVDTMHLSTVRTSDDKHDVDAALSNRNNRSLTCSEVHHELVVFGWRQCLADNLTRLESRRGLGLLAHGTHMNRGAACKADHEGTRE
jgi:hypothetical protein